MTGDRSRQILTPSWPFADTERDHWVSQAAPPERPPDCLPGLLCFELDAEDSQEYARAALSVPNARRQEMPDRLRTVRQLAAHDTAENATILDAIMNVEPARPAHGRHVRLPDATYGPDLKAIVWEHKSHIDDARCTSLANEGMFNFGQLVRQEHDADGVVLVGIVLPRRNHGDGAELGAPMDLVEVTPARAGGWEQALHPLHIEPLGSPPELCPRINGGAVTLWDARKLAHHRTAHLSRA